MFGKNLSCASNNKNISGLASMSTTTNSLIEYLLNLFEMYVFFLNVCRIFIFLISISIED